MLKAQRSARGRTVVAVDPHFLRLYGSLPSLNTWKPSRKPWNTIKYVSFVLANMLTTSAMRQKNCSIVITCLSLISRPRWYHRITLLS